MEFLSDKEAPPAVLQAYNAIKTSLKGLHSITAQIGDNAFHLTAHNANVFALFPSDRELGIED